MFIIKTPDKGCWSLLMRCRRTATIVTFKTTADFSLSPDTNTGLAQTQRPTDTHPAQLCVGVRVSLVQQPLSDLLQLLLLSLPVSLVSLHLLLSVSQTLLQRTAPRGHNEKDGFQNNGQSCSAGAMCYRQTGVVHTLHSFYRIAQTK